MRRVVYLIALCCFFNQSYAVTSGAAEVAKLVELIELAKEELEKHKEALEEVKMANDLATEMKETLNQLKKQHEYYSDFDPQGDRIKDVLNDSLGEARFNVLLEALIQSFQGLDPETQSELKDQHSATLDLMEQRAELMEIKAHYQETALSARQKDLSKGDLDVITASSAAVLAADAVARQQAEIEAEIKRQENLIRNLEHNNSMLKFFRGEE